jgi:hypothetical protein
VEGGFLVPRSLDMLLEEGQPQMLLDNGLDSVPLQVEHVLCILGHRSHVGMKVRTLRVSHGLKTLPPHGLLLLVNRKQCDRHRGGVIEAALTQGGEGDVCCLLDSLVQLDADDSRSPWLCQTEGYHHADLTPVLTMGRRHVTTVGRSVPIVAEVEECVIQYVWKPRAMLARGAKAPTSAMVMCG